MNRKHPRARHALGLQKPVRERQIAPEEQIAREELLGTPDRYGFRTYDALYGRDGEK